MFPRTVGARQGQAGFRPRRIVKPKQWEKRWTTVGHLRLFKWVPVDGTGEGGEDTSSMALTRRATSNMSAMDRAAALAIDQEEEDDQPRALRPKRERTVKSFANLLEDEEDDDEAGGAVGGAGGAADKDKGDAANDDDLEYAGPKSKRRKLNDAAPTWRREDAASNKAAAQNAADEREDGFEEAPDDDDE